MMNNKLPECHLKWCMDKKACKTRIVLALHKSKPLLQLYTEETGILKAMGTCCWLTINTFHLATAYQYISYAQKWYERIASAQPYTLLFPFMLVAPNHILKVAKFSFLFHHSYMVSRCDSRIEDGYSLWWART